MARYRKKANEVHAYQWTKDDVPGVCRCNMLSFQPHVHAHRGEIRPLRPGDWVVHDLHNTRYVVPDQEFQESFAPVVPRMVRRLLETVGPRGKSILERVDPDRDHGCPKRLGDGSEV